MGILIVKKTCGQSINFFYVSAVHVALSRNSTGKNIVLPDIPDQPHRPAATFIYLKREFGKKIIVRRSFQPSWFTNWPWLHYCKDSDVVFCHTCVSALRQKKMQLNRGNDFFC